MSGSKGRPADVRDYVLDAEEILREASEPTLEVIVWLVGQVSPSFAPVLTKLGEHLFEPNYSIAKLAKAVAPRSPSSRKTC